MILLGLSNIERLLNKEDEKRIKSVRNFNSGYNLKFAIFLTNNFPRKYDQLHDYTLQ